MERPRPRPVAPPPREDPVRFAWVARLAGTVLALYVRLVARTLRPSGPTVTQTQVIWAIWHESNLAAAVALYRLRDDKRTVAFSTRGFRGIVMNTMLVRLGSGSVTVPAEGSAGRGEAASVSRALARLAQLGSSLLVSCDGPFGPYRVAKPGVLIVARQSGLPVLPMAVAIRPPFRLRGRWDRQLIPLPFARLRVDSGEPLHIAPRERIKPRLEELQRELDRLAGVAERRMGR